MVRAAFSQACFILVNVSGSHGLDYDGLCATPFVPPREAFLLPQLSRRERTRRSPRGSDPAPPRLPLFCWRVVCSGTESGGVCFMGPRFARR